MVSVGIKELKEKLSGYVARVSRGEEIIVTDRGREVAMVVPISGERSAVRRLAKTGRASWSGGKPKGVTGIRIQGAKISKTILDDRR